MGVKRVTCKEVSEVWDLVSCAADYTPDFNDVHNLQGESAEDVEYELGDMEMNLEMAESDLRSAREKLHAVGVRLGVYPSKKKRRKK